MKWSLFCKLQHGFAHRCWTFAYLLFSRTLEFLMRHLARLADYCSITNMHTKNLAIVWAPNLLRYFFFFLFWYKIIFYIYKKQIIPFSRNHNMFSSWEVYLPFFCALCSSPVKLLRGSHSKQRLKASWQAPALGCQTAPTLAVGTPWCYCVPPQCGCTDCSSVVAGRIDSPHPSPG